MSDHLRVEKVDGQGIVVASRFIDLRSVSIPPDESNPAECAAVYARVIYHAEHTKFVRWMLGQLKRSTGEMLDIDKGLPIGVSAEAANWALIREYEDEARRKVAELTE